MQAGIIAFLSEMEEESLGTSLLSYHSTPWHSLLCSTDWPLCSLLQPTVHTLVESMLLPRNYIEPTWNRRLCPVGRSGMLAKQTGTQARMRVALGKI